MTKLDNFLPSTSDLIKHLDKYFEFSHETLEYKLEFNDNISKFRYIKDSGVSGGKRQLNIKQMRSLISEYPHSYLEFEVLFVWGRVK
jgi:malonyl-CoA O-methyltransferase